MSLRRVAPALVLAAVAVAITLALVLRSSGRVDQAAPADADSPEVAVEARLLPRTLSFGDTLTATVDLTVDRRRVDPASVRVRQEFSPWGLVARPRQTRQDAASTSYLRTTYVLRCVISPCVPPREAYQLEFDPAVVSYRRVKDREPESVEARWPVLVINTNIVAADLQQREAVTSPWRADLVSLPKA